MAQSRGRMNKGEGSYYTPKRIAGAILDIAGYSADNPAILDSRIIDPAAGDGAIITVALERFITAACAGGYDASQTAEAVARHFHAYELDEGELDKAKQAMVDVAAAHGIGLRASDLVHFAQGDARKLFRADAGQMGFVVGNPPYVRIHNLADKPESAYIEGMCDLFYLFFDLGQQLLADNGTLCFIAPSSWFTARAGRRMRNDFEQGRRIGAVCDYGHFQVFAPYATSYTAIVRIDRRDNAFMDVYAPNPATGEIGKPARMAQQRCWVNGLFLPGSPAWLCEALNAKGDIRVRNGYATNLDRVFVSQERRFEACPFERPVVKASTCQGHFMLYPYDERGALLSLDELRRQCPEAVCLLEANKQALLSRTQVPPDTWWRFGRTQGIADTFEDKVAVQGMIKPGEPLRVRSAPAGCGVYGGVYVLGLDERCVREALDSPEFAAYAAALRKYKAGGYYSFGGKDLERFLNWFVSGRS